MNKTESTDSLHPEYDWKCQPEADQMFRQLVADFCDECDFAGNLARRMKNENGTRLFDWVDHISLAEDTQLNDSTFEEQLKQFGYQSDGNDEHGRWYKHHGGLFVPICVTAANTNRRMVLSVESIDDFLAAHRLVKTIEGPKFSTLRRAMIAEDNGCEFWVCERHGSQGWNIPDTTAEQRLKSLEHFENFKLRPRNFETDAEGYSNAQTLIRAAISDLGVDWTCDLFFAAERDYWQRRNLAARVQKDRQDRLGLGWANHDHHTYRNSRERFKDLIEVFELLGFHCRERFYAGEQAGWGAQVLEQANVGIVIFADVDLTPAELAGDFAHDGLQEKSELGTVGLWCQLHGEAFLQAGMHHLECTFDFDAARSQLEEVGISSMAPFTDFGYLRQAFTTGEVWKPIPSRVEAAVAKGFISRADADKFLKDGTIGSHMEILERNEGFKGFNQTGVSDIIRKTDPRKIGV